MKTYLLDVLNKYKRFSETLDAKTILCNKSWLVLNNFKKNVFIFLENYSLIYSVNGKITNGTWNYITANKSIIITFKEHSYMFHPLFVNEDNSILILQQDGTDSFLYMIDENQENQISSISQEEINSFFGELVSSKTNVSNEQEKVELLTNKKSPDKKERRLSRKEKEDIKRKEKWQEKRRMFEKELEKSRLDSLKRQAMSMEANLNSTVSPIIAKSITFRATDLNGLKFHEISEIAENEKIKVEWLYPNPTEISLIVQTGDEKIIFNDLKNIGNKIIQIPKIESSVILTLKALWETVYVYKIIILNKKEE